MKLQEIKIGEFFAIENTKSYPKLRTEYGYIDVRDEIKKECKDLPWELSLMTDDEILKGFGEKYGFTKAEISKLKKELLIK